MKVKDIDFPRIGLILIGVGAGFAAGWVWGPAMPEDKPVLRVATIFSLLFGMVMTVIISLGDPTKLFGTSWRSASVHKRENRQSMLRYMILLYMYFTVIGLTFASSIVSNPYPAFALLLDRASIAIGSVAFVWTLGMPIGIYWRNLKQLDREAEKRWERDTSEPKIL